MFKRFLSSIIDFVFVLLFTVILWAALDGATGTHFDVYFVSEHDAMFNIRVVVAMFLGLSAIYHLFQALGGSSLGKRMIGMEATAKATGRLVAKELGVKWGVVYALPLLLACVLPKAGSLLFAVMLLGVCIGNIIVHKIKGQSLFDYIFGVEYAENVERGRYTRSSFFALLIDVCAVMGVAGVLRQYLVYGYFNILYALVGAYLLLIALSRGWSVGRALTRLSIATNGQRPTLLQMLLREFVCKYLLLMLLPLALLRMMGIFGMWQTFLNTITVIGFVCAMRYVRCGSFWWSEQLRLGKVQGQSAKSAVFTGIAVAVLAVGGFALLRYKNNTFQNTQNTFFGFKYPLEFKRSNASDAKRYVDFVRTVSQSPKEYMLSLWRNHDVVILCETFHGESTQWEFIQELVADNFFIDSVGTVFTEYGSVTQQGRMDAFLNAQFDSDTARQKAAAAVTWPRSGGFYHYLCAVSRINSGLEQEKKIRNICTDNMNWDYIVHTRNAPDSLDHGNRDSVMAQEVIDWYRQAKQQGGRHKCLVITNYRHAFGYPLGVDKFENKKYLKLYSGNEGQYIFSALGSDAVANVMQLTPCASPNQFIVVPFNAPIHGGLWDYAMAQNDHRSVGFNLLGSPFGSDAFDMFPLGGGRTELQYQDMFTGIIYNRPYSELTEVGVPYALSGMLAEYEQKMATASPEEQQFLTQQKDFYAQYYTDDEYAVNPESYLMGISRANAVELFFTALSLLICAVGGAVACIANLRR